MEQFYFPGEHKSIIRSFQLILAGDPNEMVRNVEAFFTRTQAPIDLADEQGSRLLHWVCYMGFKEVIKFLLENGANPNTANAKQETALHSATLSTYNQRIEMAQMLINYGANVSAQDKEGSTVLHSELQTLSMSGPSPDYIVFMIEQGADIHCLDNYGRTPFELLKRTSKKNIAGPIMAAWERHKLNQDTPITCKKTPTSRL